MKTVYEIAKANGIGPVTLYKRIKARGIKTSVVKGVMYLDKEQEASVLTYSKRGRKDAQDKEASDQKSVK